MKSFLIVERSHYDRETLSITTEAKERVLNIVVAKSRKEAFQKWLKQQPRREIKNFHIDNRSLHVKRVNYPVTNNVIHVFVKKVD
ncbi:hypothetical protein [Lactococcus lactis]|uniref:Uncharacterized protein n=1 Tax=Lactococcus lactis TaxID=1358 RepID=A0AB35KE26_9LACT|nr:hypothetical protein [Lactococcus lactis]MDG5049603.1 hypothetical protein [Lactococcus lactis]PAL03029.1 hypothetical protein B8W91_08860 [Lactococcus lactis]